MSQNTLRSLYHWFFWVTMPFIAIALMAILYRERLMHDGLIWANTFPLLMGIGYLSWRLHLAYDFWVRLQFPSLPQTGKRILLKLGVNGLVMTPTILVIFYLLDRFHIAAYQLQVNDLKWAVLAGLCLNIVFETLLELLYILEKLSETTAQSHALVEKQLNTEFEGLKQKVNPHFLFNCFNTLSALIVENREKAEQFLDELSKVYRYLLQNNEDDVSTLENEIRFIRSYVELLKMRHGEAVNFNIRIDNAYRSFVLPSLSLQLLVENGVKHNVLSRNRPLAIDIFTTSGHQVVVTNTRQRRSGKVPGTQTGLKNIRERYALLGALDCQIMEDESNFTVVLPLIWNSKSKSPRPVVTGNEPH